MLFSILMGSYLSVDRYTASDLYDSILSILFVLDYLDGLEEEQTKQQFERPFLAPVFPKV